MFLLDFAPKKIKVKSMKAVLSVAIFIIAIVFVFGLAVFSRLQGGNYKTNLYKSKTFMTDNERDFFSRLKEALPHCHIFAQVSLGALLQPNVRGDNRKYYSVRGTFSQKIADYVVCDRNMNVVAIVELDDKTHNTHKDEKRDAMLIQAGYAVVRWRSKHKPTIQEISEKITALQI